MLYLMCIEGYVFVLCVLGDRFYDRAVLYVHWMRFYFRSIICSCFYVDINCVKYRFVRFKFGRHNNIMLFAWKLYFMNPR
jgi:hypothetical protein